MYKEEEREEDVQEMDRKIDESNCGQRKKKYQD